MFEVSTLVRTVSVYDPVVEGLVIVFVAPVRFIIIVTLLLLPADTPDGMVMVITVPLTDILPVGIWVDTLLAIMYVLS